LIIFSHRGNIDGKIPRKENTAAYLAEAARLGFQVEFDINFNPGKTNLVLSHDEAELTSFNILDEFLTTVGDSNFHALNIKNPFTTPTILEKLKALNIRERFFLFDFELLIPDKRIAAFFMNAIQQQGFNVAYRLSERENYFDEYCENDNVKLLWMDEFSEPWIRKHHIEKLAQRGKQTIYVSPDLHGQQNLDRVKKRWEIMINAGVSGICTDFPIVLRKQLGLES
jgi:glycerophosphoryl diester phosphodiesterase